MDEFTLDFPRAHGKPVTTGLIRCLPEDFQVEEIPGYEITGAGEHSLLLVRKKGANTTWVADQIARFAGVRQVDVGFAGRKDRDAITTQWFSCWLPGRPDPDWRKLGLEGVEILESVRHNRKLKTGALRANRFRIVVRGLCLEDGIRAGLQDRLEQIKSRGVPNYFGAQRFGRDGSNLRHADQMLNRVVRVRDRQKKSIYLSAARSYLFNLALAARVEDGSWCQRKDSGGSQIGSLFGIGEFDSPYEKSVKDNFSGWCDALLAMGMKRSYRPLMVEPAHMSWCFDEQAQLTLKFELPRGSFATTLLEELIDMQESTTQDQIDE